MSQYFSAMFRRRPNEGWFRVSRYDATTVDILCALAVFSMFIYGASLTAFGKLLFFAPEVREGYEVWRLVTWPIATQPELFALIGVVFFWVFGQQLEGLFGRNRFVIWVLGVALIPSVLLTILGAFSSELDFGSVNFGLSTLFLCGIWVYAGTYPNVRWFEIMPLWGLAAIFTVLNLLQYSGSRSGGQIIFMLSAIAAGLSIGRSLGLATAWPIPHIPLGGSPGGSSTRSSGGRVPKPKRRPKQRGGGAKVVEGPWQSGNLAAPTGPPTRPPASAADQAELDGLLDKIGSQGMEALSSDEKARLNELSKRLRNR